MRKRLLVLPIIFLAISCQDDNLPPVARCTAFPMIGDTTMAFEFNAGKSLDNGMNVSLSYRWDFDGDTIWDTGYRSENVIGHYFEQPGNYHVLVEVSDFKGLSDTADVTVTVYGRNREVGTMTDPRDGQVYRTVKIKGDWWMAENLRYGTVIDKKTEQKDNSIVEMYRWSPENKGDTVGGTYRWQEAMNYNLNSNQGICPDGWHIPTYSEFENLFADLPNYYSVPYYGLGGFSGLDLFSNGIVRSYVFGEDISGGPFGYWSSSYQHVDGKIYPAIDWYQLNYRTQEIGYQHESGPENTQKYVFYQSLRCIKD